MKTTESESHYQHLDTMTISELLTNINREDTTVPLAVAKAIPQIESLVAAIVTKMKLGGRLFYIGAGTSGRLGIVDASECPPTFGVAQGLIVGIIAGGDTAIRQAVEGAEDNTKQGWKDLHEYQVSTIDVVIGIAASGSTPYVVGALDSCQQNGITTGCVVCNSDSAAARLADYPVEVIVGPEFVTGSTRMKAGTAQKLVLNMLSTAVMIQLGRVEGNRMVNMQMSNDKLIERGVQMIVASTGIDYTRAQQLLASKGSVKTVLDSLKGA